jgi:hypothetical protein
VLVLNVTTLTRGFHAAEFKSKDDDPYAFAARHHLPVNNSSAFEFVEWQPKSGVRTGCYWVRRETALDDRMRRRKQTSRQFATSTGSSASRMPC